MNMLATLASDDSIATEKDSVGGSRVLESGLYGFKVVFAYVTKSAAASKAPDIV